MQARGRHSWSRRHACWTWSQQQAWLVGGGSLHRAPAAEDTSEPKHTFHGGLAADRLAAVIAQRKAVRSRGHGGVPWSSLSMWPISAVFSAFSSEHDSSDFIETPVKGPSRCTEDVSALPPFLKPRAAICWRSFLAAQRDRHHSSLRRRRNLSPLLPIGGRVSSARWRLALLPLLQSCRAAGGSSWPQRRLDARRPSRIEAHACGIDPASQPGCGAPTGAGRACP